MASSDKSKLTTIKRKAREIIDRLLQGTHDHYLCFLSGNIGSLSSLILESFFSGIKISQEDIEAIHKLPEDGIFVYVTKHKSYFEHLFYFTRFKQNGLAFPEISLDYKFFLFQPISHIFRTLLASLDYILHHLSANDPYKSGYIKKSLINGRTAIVSLVGKKGFYRRFVKAKRDPIQYIIEIQKSINRPIYIIPQLMFFSRTPHRSTPTIIDILLGTKEHPGKIRRLLTLFKHPGKVFVETSKPLNLKNFLQSAENRDKSIEYQTFSLRSVLLKQINNHRKSITGPVLKSAEELKENILTNEQLQNFMAQHSKRRNISLQKIYKKADGYLDEIAARYSLAVIKIGSVIVKWILQTMFEGVVVNNEMLAKVKNMSQKGPLILMPCHKSHIDYLILSYVLYNNNMPCPLIAAGKNLSFWPIGSLFRAGGAFFIRRTFKGAVLYAKVFSGYIYKLLEEGFNIELFIEGGRSRTGKLIIPQLGLLSILLGAYKKGACDDMILVPIYIGYDQVLEESSYIHEIEGGQKKPESLLQVIKAGKLLKKKYGKIYIKFHEPVSLNKILSRYDTSIYDMTSKEQNALIRNLGHRIINAINNVSIVTPYALAASIILNCPKKSFTYDYLISIVDNYLSYLFSQKVELADTLLLNPAEAIKNTLDSYAQRKFIEQVSTNKTDPSSPKLFKVNENKRLSLEYYKNNCISFFIPAAFTALAILEKDAFQFFASDLHKSYSFLQEFFKNEFAYNIDLAPDHYVRKTIKSFIDDAILVPHPVLPDAYNLTSLGFRKLQLFSSFLKTYFESYWIVLSLFMRYPKNSINAKVRLKKVQSRGRRMYKRKEIERKESLSKINYQNAIDYFIAHGVRGMEDDEKINLYVDSIQKYMNHFR